MDNKLKDKFLDSLKELENSEDIPVLIVEIPAFENDEFEETKRELIVKITTDSVDFVNKSDIPF